MSIPDGPDFISEINFLPDERPQDYVKLKAALFAEFKPCGPSEEKIVTSVAKVVWKLKRAQRSRPNHGLAGDTQ
jgi:hypothetical protein